MTKGLIFSEESVRTMLREVDLKTQTRRLRGLIAANAEPEKWKFDLMDNDRSKKKLYAIFGEQESIPGALVDSWRFVKCPWNVGDEVYAKEMWRVIKTKGSNQEDMVDETADWEKALQVQYKSDMSLRWIPVAGGAFLKYHPIRYIPPVGRDIVIPWRSPLLMPRLFARPELFRTITEIRCERVQEISEKDALAEGIYKTQSEWGYHWYYWNLKEPREGYLSVAWGHLWNSLHAKPRPVRANSKWAKALGWWLIPQGEAKPKEIVGYISFPFSAEDGDQRETIQGKPHKRCVNPFSWVLEFGNVK